MTEDDKILIISIANAIRQSPAGKRMTKDTALELAAVAHHAIRDRLPRDTR